MNFDKESKIQDFFFFFWGGGGGGGGGWGGGCQVAARYKHERQPPYFFKQDILSRSLLQNCIVSFKIEGIVASTIKGS